jgi:hypothetical protein
LFPFRWPTWLERQKSERLSDFLNPGLFVVIQVILNLTAQACEATALLFKKPKVLGQLRHGFSLYGWNFSGHQGALLTPS